MDDEPELDATKAALYELAIAMHRDSLPAMPDEIFTRILALYHEEWDRRTGAHWGLQ